jgi:tartrate-resistant acid phosphatase type 5
MTKPPIARRPWTRPLCLSIAFLCAIPPALRLAHAADSTTTPKPGSGVKPAATKAATKPATTKLAASKPASKPVVAKWQSRPFPADEVNLIVFGDFGNGKQTQKDTAKAMAAYVEKVGTQSNGALTVGDNFYVKFKDVNDYQFQSLFEDMYDARRLNFRFYVSCGNHDWEKADGNKTKLDLELEYTAKHPDSRWTYPNRWHRVDFPQGSAEPLVTALMLESSMPRLKREEWESEKAWIEQQLSSTKAKWKIACAHHPFFSNGSHGDNGVMQKEWGPIFKKYGVDMYLGGHDHDLQHLEIPGWPISFVQAGGGGQSTTDMRRDLRGPFSRKIYGFIHLQIKGDRADVKYIATKDGKPIHEFVREKPTGAIRIVSTTGRDKATTRPLRTLLGIREGSTRPSDVKPEIDDDGEQP